MLIALTAYLLWSLMYIMYYTHSAKNIDKFLPEILDSGSYAVSFCDIDWPVWGGASSSHKSS